MITPQQKILCVEPSPTQRAIFARIAGNSGLACESCESESAALQHLAANSYCLVLIARQLGEGDSFRLIESIRLAPAQAMLPIAFVAAECDSLCAHQAMVSGATEVFLREELSELASFVDYWGRSASAPVQIGRALVLEDSASHAAYVSEICRMLGFEVDVVADVDGAHRLYAPGKYQLVIADILLQGGHSGAAFVRQVRQRQASHQPCLVMSAYTDQTQRLQALKSGADDFICKPFLPEELVWRIQRILHAHAAFDHGSGREGVPGGGEHRWWLQLSPRERDVCRRILAGDPDKEIARQLGISFWTVRSHIEQIFVKTGALNRRDLMLRFMEKT